MKLKLSKFTITGSTLINLVGLIVIGYLLVVLATTVKRNYDLGRQIDNLNSQISLLKDQKDELAYSLQYYNTDSFRDREARSKLGLQLPGENVVIIPHATPTSPPAAAAPTPKTTSPKSNLQEWLDFLAGRS
jgi:cell division protein FtsB